MANQNVLATVLQAALTKKDDGGSTALLQMMQQQQSQTTQMIMEMNKNNMMMIQEMRRETQTMMEKFSHLSESQARDFRDQLKDMSSQKKDAFDPLEMFKMLQNTREDGFNFGLKLQQMAKEIAGESEGTPAAPKGIVESLFDNLGKVAPLLMAAQAAPSPVALPAPSQQPRLVAAPPAPSYKKPVATTNPVVAKAAQVIPVTKPSTPGTVQAVPQTPKTPTATKPTGRQGIKTAAKQTTTQGVVASATEADKIAEEAQLKEAIIQICVPLIGNAIQTGKTAANLGEETISVLGQRGVAVATAVSLVSEQDILDVAFKRYSLPQVPELVTYLKDYHAYLRQKASP